MAADRLGLLVLIGLGMLAARLVPDIGPSITAPPTAAAPRLGTVGSVGQTRDVVLWVDSTSLWAWDRAYANRDQRGQTSLELFTLDVFRHEGVELEPNESPTEVRTVR